MPPTATCRAKVKYANHRHYDQSQQSAPAWLHRQHWWFSSWLNNTTWALSPRQCPIIGTEWLHGDKALLRAREADNWWNQPPGTQCWTHNVCHPKATMLWHENNKKLLFSTPILKLLWSRLSQFQMLHNRDRITTHLAAETFVGLHWLKFCCNQQQAHWGMCNCCKAVYRRMGRHLELW